jgi:hypothetical protein
MNTFASFHKRKTLFLVILFIAFTAFTTDILDLRDELHVLSCPSSNLDNNVTTGITSTVDFALESVILFCSVQERSSVKVSFLHLFPYTLRAPPPWS